MASSKKAASPIFITLILVVIALTMGIVIVKFDSAPRAEDAVCEGAYDVKIIYVGDKPRVCQKANVDPENNSLSFLLENKAAKDIDGLHLTFVGNSLDVEKQVFIIRDYNASIKSDGALSKAYKFPKTIGELEQVKISIYRKMNSYYYLCKTYSLALDAIPECN